MLQAKVASSQERLQAKVVSSRERLQAKEATSQKRLQALPAKLGAQARQDIICAYCSEWRTIQQIATYLGRGKDYLRNKVLPKLLGQGVLEQRYNSKNHPNQQYRTRQER